MSPRLSSREKLKRLMDCFGREDRVLVPIVADPDSLAAALALRRLLWRQTAGVTIAPINEIVRRDNLTMIRLLRIKMTPFKDVNPADFNRFVLVDGQPDHNEAFNGLNFNVIIDHHPVVDSSSGADFVDIRPQYGATATIMTEYLKAAKITPSQTLATALFYAIKTDTDSFLRPAVSEDMVAFRYLYRYANLNLIRKVEYSELPLSLLKGFVTALERIKIRKEKAIAYLGRVNTPDSLVLVADFMMRIQSIDTTMAAGIYQDKLVVIFRNVRARRNIGRLAEKTFGQWGSAGGHSSAARAETPLSAIKDLVNPEDDEAMERFVIQTIQGIKTTPPNSDRK